MANYGADNPIQLSNFATKETNRVLGKINQGLVQKSVWTNVLKGGIFTSGMGDSVRTVVQLPSITPGLNYAQPGLTDFTAICGNLGNQTKHSTVEYTTKLQAIRGRGPDICVNQGYGAFKGWMEQATTMLANDIRLIRDAIDRSQTYAITGTKYTCLSSVGFLARIAGGTEADAGVLPIATLPDAGLSFAALRRLVAYAKESLYADPYTLKVEGVSGGYDQFALLIGSQELIDGFRNETAVQTEINAMVTGGFKFGEKAITSLNFQTAGAWKGVAMKSDQFPLRYDEMDDGVPVFLNPFEEVIDDAPGNRSHRRTNPAWLASEFEVAFVMFADSIERLVPERYTGDGTAKFDARLGNGQIEWHYIKDNTTNAFGDFGFHKYEMAQAYRPIRPHHAIAVHYKRCAAIDLTAC